MSIIVEHHGEFEKFQYCSEAEEHIKEQIEDYQADKDDFEVYHTSDATLDVEIEVIVSIS